MSNVKEIRVRIKSIKNTAKITKAMQLVAAAKMRRAQEAANAGKPYSELINQVLRGMIGGINPLAHPLLTGNGQEKDLIVAISSDRGLAGALVSNLIRKLTGFKTESEFISLGAKAKAFFAKTGREVIADFPLPENGSLETIRPLTKLLIEKFLSREIGRVFVVYTQFFSTLRQEPATKQLLPVMDRESFEALKSQDEKEGEEVQFKFEPNADQILDQLLPHYILMELTHYLLEARASEHSARMLAMKNATDNALELVDDLTLTYNQIRQEAITKEILDISTAAIALE
ncbi:MAG: ATP synthase F1 subunit gamma [bacterium]|nr:ATP synthase F1 subunit gamma [bacterium]